MAQARRRPKTAFVDDRSSAHALDLDNYIPAYLTWIANKMSSSASAIYRKRFGVGIVDWRIMALLAVEPWIVAGRICDVIGIDKAAVSRSVALMQQKGLVETRFQDNNQRRQYIALTLKGIELHDAMVQVAHEREEALLAGFTAAERKTAVDLLARMHARLPDLGGAGGK